MSNESRAVALVRWQADAVRQRRDDGFMTRLIESYADSFHSPATTADVVNLACAAVLRISELTGADFETVLADLDRPGVVKLPRPTDYAAAPTA